MLQQPFTSLFARIAVLLAFFSPCLAPAFNGNKASSAPLHLTIAPIGTVTERGTPIPVSITVANSAEEPLSVSLSFGGLIDGCSAVGDTKCSLTLPARGETVARFQFVVGPEAYSAHYPAHVRAVAQYKGQPVSVHAVDVFVTEFKDLPARSAKSSAPDAAVSLAPGGALALASLPNALVSWARFDKSPVTLPAGWQGSDPISGAAFTRGSAVRGDARAALQMHPPFRGGPGVVAAEYRVRLPDLKPLRLSFFNAIRDSAPSEPLSDGVTFRVSVDGTTLFDRHSASKSWQEGTVDLSAFAGREIRLRLESHPGPRHNTVCDSCFWGDPIIFSGERPAPRSAADKAQDSSRTLAAALAPAATDVPANHLFVFSLSGNARAALTLGPNGLADGFLAFAQNNASVSFSGFNLSILDSRLGSSASELVTEDVSAKRTADGRLVVVHRIRRHSDIFDLTAELWSDGPGLRVRFTCPQRLTDLAPGNADRVAKRVYFGHGYCITDPGAFTMHGGGHNLAASHVGADFEGGLSVVTACDTPADAFIVDPARRTYALHTKPDSTFTFVPGSRGAFACALAFRQLSEKRAAAGFINKAGRFVFDFWGQSYRDNAARIRRAASYGITDAILVLHVWQRWGYDYRLPDIFPPDPKLGSLEDMQELAKACASRGILFAPHDNYIDFYPDADEFSYDHITFHSNGTPRKAWINNGRDAQSYQFRPDRLRHFLDRNLSLLVPALRPSSYFVDVFSSANVFDYYDREGNFHSKLETQRLWGDCFAAIRNALGGNAPTISEAGDDCLIGWLDGADCQFLSIAQKPRMFQLGVPCGSWTRVPWMDAVHHTRFSLHGVGYSSRYQGGASRSIAGIESDDYISAELLTGHALMSDLQAGVRGDVRKYWLAHDFIRSIALDEISSVDFANDDPKHLVISWKSGAIVRVNRSTSDWTVAGRVLPPNGYWAVKDSIESMIERRGNSVVEWSRSGDTLYVNGRGPQPDSPLPIRPSLGKFRQLSPRKFILPIHWEASAPSPTPLASFLHIYQPQKSRLKKVGWVAASEKPAVPTTKWKGLQITGASTEIVIPDDCPAGEYEITVGLYESGKPRAPRARLLGDEDSERRIVLGTLILEGKKNNITGMRVVPATPLPSWQTERLAPNRSPSDFGPVSTSGACRLSRDPKGAWVLTPLPDSQPSVFRLRPALLKGAPNKISAIEALDEVGSVISSVPFVTEKDSIVFTSAKSVFSYRIR